MLRAFRLAQGLVLDRLLEELSRLTSDAEPISAATRKLIALVTEYRQVQWRLSAVNEASVRVGTTLDIALTAEELADLATDHTDHHRPAP